MAKGAEKRWVEAILRWRERLWCNQWQIIHVAGSVKGDGDQAALAEIRPRIRYENATLTTDLALLPDLDRVERERAACHEISHLVLAPVGEVVHQLLEALPEKRREGYAMWWDKEHEAVTTHLTKIFTQGVRSWRD